MSWPSISESDFPWLPIPEEGISRDVDPQLYGLPANYHILPEDLRARARSQRLALSLTYSNREVSASIPSSSTSQQPTTHPGSTGRESELPNILHQPVVSPAIDGDGGLEDDCRKNPNMQLFLQRHPSPTIRDRAVRRDMIARRTLGELYQQYNQDTYNVIEKRTKMTQDVETRDQELHGGMQWFTPAGNENGRKKPKHYCRSLQGIAAAHMRKHPHS
ncbi:hypothetical protein VMCG_02703 [Cytospora schulzeri]|uniref:Uncharacterized protein n=1 Tax=Cytospora schulzeri TaxID=448051 RepID=A0A423WZD2_9PEZI|nr:hypothetical protein VMCG_02703 [Valsa malicola]